MIWDAPETNDWDYADLELEGGVERIAPKRSPRNGRKTIHQKRRSDITLGIHARGRKRNFNPGLAIAEATAGSPSTTTNQY